MSTAPKTGPMHEAKAATPTATARTFSSARPLLLQRKCTCEGGPACEACEKKKQEQPLQRSALGHSATTTAPPVVGHVLNCSGRPLESSVRSFMEPRFGRDLSGVRVHTDSQAAESARAVNARAYTVGQDIVFASQQYQPSTPDGTALLAHELVHTVQHSGLQRLPDQTEFEVSGESDALEREASAAAASVLHGQIPNISAGRHPATLLHRAPWGTCPAGNRISAKPADVHDSAELKMAEYYEQARTRNVISKRNPIEKWLGSPPSEHAQMLRAMDELFRAERPSPIRRTRAEAGGEILPPARSTELTDEGEPEADESPVVAVEGRERATLEAEPEPKRPDLADLDNREIYDVTTIGEADAKVSKIATTYVAKLERIRSYYKIEGKAWTAGAKLPAPSPEILLYKYQGKNAICYGPTDFTLRPGVIAYEAIELTGTAPVITTEPYYIATKLKKATLDANPAPSSTDLLNTGPNNLSAATMIPGLVMKTLKRGKSGVDTITACVLSENCVKTAGKPLVPVTILTNEGNVDLKVDATSRMLSMAKNYTGLKFKSKHLSEGVITKLDFDPDEGVSATGTLTPSIPFLNKLKLGVNFSQNNFMITSGLDESSLKKLSAPLPGATVTKAQLELQLYPEFKPQGVVEMQIGPAQNPLAKANLTLSADSIGLVATGKLNVNIPKLQTAESDISYKAGGGRDEWLADIHIKTEDIKLGSSISVSGGFDGFIDKGGINFTGKIDAIFPGDNSAELGLKKSADDWTLFGTGKFHFPKLDETTVKIVYHLGKDVLVATGKTGFTIPAIGLSGHLDEVTFTISKGQPAKVYGKGGLDFKRGKAEGHANVELHPNGKFSGKGSLSYKLRENIIVTGTVELNEQEKLRVTGELLITRYELFKQYGDKKDLFNVDVPVPVPALSIGTSGVVFHIRGGVGVAYSFGPGTIEPLKFSAGFDPLESDPDLELAVTGTVKVPASASLSAHIEGTLAIQVDIVVGSAGAEGGLRLTGELTLSAGAFAKLDAAYKKKHLTAHVDAGIDTKLLLGLSLTAFVRAWAGAFGLTAETRKDWTLARKVIDTGLGFYISAPFDYADDKGIKLPELKDITLKEPDVSTENLKRILGEIFGSSSEKKTES